MREDCPQHKMTQQGLTCHKTNQPTINLVMQEVDGKSLQCTWTRIRIES